jgi:hypothetical protein
MDPITGAIVAALTALAEPAVKDAYAGLKAVIVRRFGRGAEVTKAVKTLEAKPDSPGRRAALAEEIAASGAAQDQELLRLAQLLAERAQAGTTTSTVHQQVQGDRNVVSGTGDITINIDRPRGPRAG